MCAGRQAGRQRGKAFYGPKTLFIPRAFDLFNRAQDVKRISRNITKNASKINGLFCLQTDSQTEAGLIVCSGSWKLGTLSFLSVPLLELRAFT